MYKENYLYYQKDNVGDPIISIKDGTPVMLGHPKSGVGLGFDNGKIIGYFTGYYTEIDNVSFVEIEFNTPIFLNGKTYFFGAVNGRLVNLLEQKNNQNANAQSVLNQLLENQKTILENNLVCAMLLSKVQGTAKQKQRLSDLQARLLIRDEKIKQSTFIEGLQFGTPDTELSQYASLLAQHTASPQIGVVLSTTAIIVISAIVVVVTSGVTYLIVSGALKESNLDLKYSDELTAELVKLLPKETYEKLMKENAAFSRVANRAVKFASGSSYLKMAGYIAVGVAGFYALDAFSKSTKK